MTSQAVPGTAPASTASTAANSSRIAVRITTSARCVVASHALTKAPREGTIGRACDACQRASTLVCNVRPRHGEVRLRARRLAVREPPAGTSSQRSDGTAGDAFARCVVMPIAGIRALEAALAASHARHCPSRFRSDGALLARTRRAGQHVTWALDARCGFRSITSRCRGLVGYTRSSAVDAVGDGGAGRELRLCGRAVGAALEGGFVVVADRVEDSLGGFARLVGVPGRGEPGGETQRRVGEHGLGGAGGAEARDVVGGAAVGDLGPAVGDVGLQDRREPGVHPQRIAAGAEGTQVEVAAAPLAGAADRAPGPGPGADGGERAG